MIEIHMYGLIAVTAVAWIFGSLLGWLAARAEYGARLGKLATTVRAVKEERDIATWAFEVQSRAQGRGVERLDDEEFVIDRDMGVIVHVPTGAKAILHAVPKREGN